MLKKCKELIVVFVFLGLVACKQELSYSYLIQHPAILKTELERCQSNKNQTKEEELYCQTVNSAAVELLTYVNDMQQNPEQFGQDIIDTQIASVEAKKQLREAKQQLDKAAPSTKEYETAKEQLADAEKEYAEKENRIKTMLAIVGMSSPE